MNKTITFLSACALGIGTAFAASDSFTSTQFPPHLMGADYAGVERQAMMKSPLNVDKQIGPYMFGVTANGEFSTPEFVQFYQGSIQKLKPLNFVYLPDDEDEAYYPPLYRFLGGCMTDRGYFGYKVKYYTIGLTYVFRWLKVDPYTGQHEIVADLNDKDIQENWENIYNMTYNWNTKKLYGLANNENGSVTSMVGELDFSNGEFSKKIASLDDYYFAIAAGMDNNFYAIRWIYDADNIIIGTSLDVFDPSFKKIRESEVKVDGEVFKPYYSHGLDFDHTTGDLWWTATDTGAKQFLVKLDPVTGEGVSYGAVGYNDVVIGLALPNFLTADAMTAPAQVSDLTFDICKDGSNEVTLSWTNPTTQWNREPLASMEEVYVYRDDMKNAPVVKLPAKNMMGEKMTWKDTSAARGLHKYFVAAANVADQNGVPDTLWAFVGRDVIGPVENLRATSPDGKTVTLTWDSPVRGDNDGWFSDKDRSYRITRLPDGKVFDNVITDNHFEDTDIPEAMTYTYVVTSYNEDGKGGSAESDPILAGNALKAPVTLDFNDESNANRFTVIDLNGDGVTFSYGYNTNHLGQRSMKFECDDSNNDDELVSPALRVKKGKTYRIDIGFSIGHYGESDRIIHHKYSIMGGLAPTPNDMNEELVKVSDYMTNTRYEDMVLTHYFVAPVDGDYHIGLRWMTEDEANQWIYVQDFHFEEIGDHDLQAKELLTFLSLAQDDENPNVFNVEVYNNGLSTEKDYKVEIGYDFNGNFRPFASTDDFTDYIQVPEIKSHETGMVIIIGNPDLSDDLDIKARVILDSDTNESNDYTPCIKISVVEGPALTNTFIDEMLLTESTATPLSHKAVHTTTQTIYTHEMTGLSTSSQNQLRSLAWEYEADDDFSGSEIEVYLGITGKQGYKSDTPQWVAISEPVYKGIYDIKKGRNYLHIPLTHPFEFNGNENLVVTVINKDEKNEGFLMRFSTFDEFWTNDLFHSLTYAGDARLVPSITTSAGVPQPQAPVLHVSIYDKSGVEEIVVGSSVNYDPYEGTLYSVSGLNEVRAYDFSGRLAGVFHADAATGKVKLNLAKGFYVLRAVERNGNVSTLKVSVR